MKIIHIAPIPFKQDSIGGGERYPFELALEMSKNYDVKLITFGKKRATELVEKLIIETYPVMFYIDGMKVNPFTIGFLKEIFLADILHCHQFYTFVTSMSIITGRLCGKKVFVTDHGGGGRSLAAKLGLHTMVTAFLNVSRYSRDISVWKKCKNCEIYGGISQNFIPKVVENLGEYLLFVGRVIPWKGLDYLIQALPDNVELYVAGPYEEGNYYFYLKELCKSKKVKYLGPVFDKNELRSLLNNAFGYVLPSVYTDVYGKRYNSELFPLALLEAMSMGLPVIASDVGGISEIIQDGINGLLSKPSDVEDLRKKIKQLYSHKSLREELGRGARSTILSGFTWKHVVDRAISCYFGKK